MFSFRLTCDEVKHIQVITFTITLHYHFNIPNTVFYKFINVQHTLRISNGDAKEKVSHKKGRRDRRPVISSV